MIATIGAAFPRVERLPQKLQIKLIATLASKKIIKNSLIKFVSKPLKARIARDESSSGKT